jgi:hypothetical protein
LYFSSFCWLGQPIGNGWEFLQGSLAADKIIRINHNI